MLPLAPSRRRAPRRGGRGHPRAVADCVVALMSLQDVDELERALAEAGRVLVGGGRLVMAITHPLNTAGKFEQADGEDWQFVIRGSYLARRRISDAVAREPGPADKWHRLPLFLHIRAVRR